MIAGDTSCNLDVPATALSEAIIPALLFEARVPEKGAKSPTPLPASSETGEPFANREPFMSHFPGSDATDECASSQSDDAL